GVTASSALSGRNRSASASTRRIRAWPETTTWLTPVWSVTTVTPGSTGSSHARNSAGGAATRADTGGSTQGRLPPPTSADAVTRACLQPATRPTVGPVRGILGLRAAAGRHRRRWPPRRRRLVVALASAAITAVAAGSALTVVDPAPRERAEVTSAGSAPAESPAAPASPTPPPEKPEEPVTPSPDPAPPTRPGTPDPRVVRAALEFSPLVRYHRDLPGGAYTNAGNTGGHTYVLAFAARAGDTSVDARLLEQIRHILTGGNDIAANGGYPSQL